MLVELFDIRHGSFDIGSRISVIVWLHIWVDILPCLKVRFANFWSGIVDLGQA
jgi:hypothetical protein